MTSSGPAVQLQDASPNVDDLRQAVIGAFRCDGDLGRWWWSAGMWRLHGYRLGPVRRPRADSQLLLRHVHRDDRAVVAAAWRRVNQPPGITTVRYRLVGADGITRTVRAWATRFTTAGRDVFSGSLELVAPAGDRPVDGHDCAGSGADGSPEMVADVRPPGGLPRQYRPDDSCPECW